MRTLKQAMHFSLLSGLMVGALAALPGTSHAAAGTSSASVRVVTGGFLQLVYTGSADANNVLITLESGTNVLRVNDSVTITPGPGCASAPNDSKTVRCSVGISRIAARLGAGADAFTTLVPLKGTVEGDGQNDTFRPSRSVGPGASNTEIMYVGGDGEDTATYAGVPATGPTGNTGVHVSLDSAANDGRDSDGVRPADKDNIQVENLIGSSFGDRLSGDGGRNKITAGNGRDTVSAGGGDDVVNVQDQAQENSVSCGEGTGDLALADRFGDTVNVDCETVQHGA
ncbi:hypothetical protein EDD27_4958 [Nonomuraea polychroma]|uniref:Hemolysin type calcium-binding protein n=1 Tax=Nonomuraea polychroma TaxID=46176 RepID=A0A438M9D6_9ACTN|nr:hypothetical protein [Nonomuraea polychroma]RVX42334.1 hypothetical protein EDD27_4958 [Nonomuraea polychroma]